MPALKRLAVTVFASRLIAFALASATPIILVRLLTQSDFGTYQQVLFLLMFSVALLGMGIPESLLYFFPRKSSALPSLFTQTITILLISSLFGACVLLILGLAFGWTPRGLPNNLVLPIVVLVFIETVAQAVKIVFIVEKRPKLIVLTKRRISSNQDVTGSGRRPTNR